MNNILRIQKLCQEYVRNEREKVRNNHPHAGDIIKRKRYTHKRKMVYSTELQRYIKTYEVFENGELITDEPKTLNQVEDFIFERIRR